MRLVQQHRAPHDADQRRGRLLGQLGGDLVAVVVALVEADFDGIIKVYDRMIKSTDIVEKLGLDVSFHVIKMYIFF